MGGQRDAIADVHARGLIQLACFCAEPVPEPSLAAGRRQGSAVRLRRRECPARYRYPGYCSPGRCVTARGRRKRGRQRDAGPAALWHGGIVGFLH